MLNIIFVSGIPGSGKTTWCTNFINNHSESYKFICVDDFRRDCDGLLPNNELDKKTDDKLYYHLNNNFNVIIESLFLTKHRRSEFTTRYKNIPNTKLICVYFYPNADLCIERQSRREVKVGSSSIIKFSEMYQVPTYDEGWDEIWKLEVKDNNKEDDYSPELIENI